MTKYFKLGAVSFSLNGDKQYIKRFGDEFKTVEISSEEAGDELDCSFSFVDKLPSESGSYIRFSNFKVGESWVDVKDFPFIYRIQREKRKLVLMVAPNRNLSVRERIIWIPTTHQLIHPSFKTKQGALVSAFIYRIWQWVIYLKLIEKGGAFIHASSVLANEKAYVFGSWGGVGKTTILLKLIMENPGVQFLSDDMTLIDMRGNVFLNPTALHIYPYNWEEFAALKDKVFANRGLIDRFSWRFWGRLKGQDRVCRRMRIEQVVGNKVGRQGLVDKFFFLKRTNTQKLAISSLENKDLVAQSFSLIQLSGMNVLREIVYPIASADVDFLEDVFSMERRLFTVYKNFLRNAEIFEVSIPSNTPPEELSSFISDQIN